MEKEKSGCCDERADGGRDIWIPFRDSLGVDMDNNEKKITLMTDDNEPVDFYVVEETKINGMNYLLVTDAKEGDGECYILKDLSKPEDADALFTVPIRI